MSNNRINKFRIWHVQDKKWIDDFSYFMTFWGGNRLKKERIPAFSATHINGEGQNVVLQQFTGKTDKNGVDIYEGDIVEYYGPHYACSSDNNGLAPIIEKHFWDTDFDVYPAVGIIEWNDKAMTYGPLVNVEGDYWNNSFFCVCDPEENEAGYYKVIGNIYENSELVQKYNLNHL